MKKRTIFLISVLVILAICFPAQVFALIALLWFGGLAIGLTVGLLALFFVQIRDFFQLKH